MSKLKPQHNDPAQVQRFLAAADKRLAAAEKLCSIDEEAAYQLAYEAMLKAALGFLLHCGVRPRSQPGHHMVVIEFVQKHFGTERKDLLNLFDRMRRKRNLSLYDVSGLISKREAEQALTTAEKLIALIRSEIRKQQD